MLPHGVIHFPSPHHPPPAARADMTQRTPSEPLDLSAEADLPRADPAPA